MFCAIRGQIENDINMNLIRFAEVDALFGGDTM